LPKSRRVVDVVVVVIVIGCAAGVVSTVDAAGFTLLAPTHHLPLRGFVGHNAIFFD
jgi:hypothetical protein